MKVIPREAGRITYSTEIRNLKKKLVLNNYQRSIVIGTILGDGNLCENWSKTNYRLSIRQSVKQKDYIFWKFKILRECILTPPKYYDKTRSISFRTISHQEFTKFRRLFYENGKKIIPKNIQEFLNPITIAVWFMDDGNAVKRDGKLIGFHLNTQSFTEKENIFLSEVFAKFYGVTMNPEVNKGKYRLAIWQKDSREKFLKIIEPYIIESMRYKIS